MHRSEGNAGSVTLHLFPNEFDYHLNRAGSVTLHLSPIEFDYHLNRAGSVTLHLSPNEFEEHLNRAGSVTLHLSPNEFEEHLNRASKACIDDDYLYSLYKSLIVAYTKSGVIPNFSKSSFVPSPLRTNTEFIPAFFPQAMSV